MSVSVMWQSAFLLNYFRITSVGLVIFMPGGYSLDDEHESAGHFGRNPRVASEGTAGSSDLIVQHFVSVAFPPSRRRTIADIAGKYRANPDPEAKDHDRGFAAAAAD